MILPAQEIQRIKPLTPFHQRTVHNGMTFGLGPAGYDVRIAEDHEFYPGNHFVKLGSTMERFEMPNNLIARVLDKSTWARQGLFVQNTVIEPGWEGFLTIELTYHGQYMMRVARGSPIAQVVFELLSESTSLPYHGKYQNQQEGPQEAIIEGENGDAVARRPGG